MSQLERRDATFAEEAIVGAQDIQQQKQQGHPRAVRHFTGRVLVAKGWEDVSVDQFLDQYDEPEQPFRFSETMSPELTTFARMVASFGSSKPLWFIMKRLSDVDKEAAAFVENALALTKGVRKGLVSVYDARGKVE